MTHGNLIYGLPALELPEGWTPLEAACVIKCLDENGEVALIQRVTPDWATWDALGPVIAMADGLRESLREGFISDDPDDDEPA